MRAGSAGPRPTPSRRPRGSPPGSGRSPRPWPSAPAAVADRDGSAGPVADRRRCPTIRSPTACGRRCPARPAGRGVLVCLPPIPTSATSASCWRPRAALLEDPAGRPVRAGPAWWRRARRSPGPSTWRHRGSRPAWWTCRSTIPGRWSGSSPRPKPRPGSPRSITTRSGRRREPILRLLPWPERSAGRRRSGPADVLLVSGGGKGIAAECALALRERDGRPAGPDRAVAARRRPEPRRQPRADGRRRECGSATSRPTSTDADAVRAAVREAESVLGPITAVLHGAGVNVPRLLGSLDEAAFLQTLAPKLRGLRNLLAAVRPDRLKLLVTFGSIIARTGMPGEADYGVANEWLTRLTERFQKRASGLPMPRPGVVGLVGRRHGGSPGARRCPGAPGDRRRSPPMRASRSSAGSSPPPRQRSPSSLAGRFGIPPALPIEGDDLPLLRFLERPLVDYPGIELVADADLTTETDPYLDDHVFRGERLFPAVMGLEAMAQAAMAVLRTDEPPRLRGRAVRPPDRGGRRPGRRRRSASPRWSTAPGRVDVVLRSDATALPARSFPGGLPVRGRGPAGSLGPTRSRRPRSSCEDSAGHPPRSRRRTSMVNSSSRGADSAAWRAIGGSGRRRARPRSPAPSRRTGSIATGPAGWCSATPPRGMRRSTRSRLASPRPRSCRSASIG